MSKSENHPHPQWPLPQRQLWFTSVWPSAEWAQGTGWAWCCWLMGDWVDGWKYRWVFMHMDTKMGVGLDTWWWGGGGGVSETLWGDLYYLHNNFKMLFASVTLNFHVCMVEFFRGCSVMCDTTTHDNAEADVRTQLSMKPNIKEICKFAKHCHPSHYFLKADLFFIKCAVYINT